MTERHRPAFATIDLAAVRANAHTLSALADPAQLMGVVKADGYGHGAVPVARALVEAGVAWLGVALVEEGAELRDAGIETPVVLLSEPPPDAAPAVVGAALVPVVYTMAWIEALAKAVATAGSDPVPVHLKVDTGMHRVGCDPQEAVALAEAIESRDELVLEGLMTHFAVADEPANAFTERQIERFEAARGRLGAAGFRPPVIHAANSAALLVAPAARYDLVRCGIALYGVPPSAPLAGAVELRPAMSLRARVSAVRDLEAGEGVSYGHHYRLSSPVRIATVPLGYADGVPRRLGLVGAEVLVAGRRRPIAGAVTMDQLMVDCGNDPVEPGDEVVLIGGQGEEEVTVTEWAERLGTIGYEIVCGVGRRVPREYVS